MKKIFTQLLIVFMCMPYIACAMPGCDREVTVVQSEVPPCPSHKQLVDNKGQEIAEIMFLLDCAGVDAQLVTHEATIIKVDFKNNDAVVVDDVAELFKASTLLEKIVQPVWTFRANPPPNIILTTQRFRL